MIYSIVMEQVVNIVTLNTFKAEQFNISEEKNMLNWML